MTTTTTIRIRNAAESEAFIKRTALNDCAHVEFIPGSGSLVERNWPGLSEGELILWDFLAYINGGDLPSMALAKQILDAPNYAVVAETVRRVEALG